MQLPWPANIETPELTVADVHVWSVALDDEPALSAEQWAVLTCDERQRAERFRVDDTRRRFVAARAALRTLLGQYLTMRPAEITFGYDSHGKPRLRNPNAPAGLQFNLAHSGEMAIVAITLGCEVGVDVERFRAVNHWQEIAERYFHPREVAQLSALKPDERNTAFMRCWTGKEAVLKAIGTGVTQSLDFFVGQCDQPDDNWIDVPTAGAGTPARCWLRPLVPGPDYAGAVACLGVQRLPRCFAFSR